MFQVSILSDVLNGSRNKDNNKNYIYTRLSYNIICTSQAFTTKIRNKLPFLPAFHPLKAYLLRCKRGHFALQKGTY